MKRFLIAVAVAFAISPARAADPVVLQWQTANLVEKQFEPVWKEMVAAFEAANPGVKIEPVLVARRDHWTRFVTAAQARRAPCLVSVDVATAAFNGYLMPLDALWAASPAAFRAAFADEVLAGARFEGKLYGVPVWGGIYAELYNRAMAEAAGLDPAHPPRSWDEYKAWMKALTKSGVWGTALTGGSTDTTARTLLSWIWSNGGEAFDPGMTRATFASDPRSMQAIRFLLDLAAQGLAAPGATATNYLEQTNLFAQGKIASMRSAWWALAKVVGDNKALAGQIVAAPPPATIPDPPVLFTQSSTSIGANCPHPDAAWKFILFEAEPRWAVKRAQVANWLPLRRDLLDAPEVKADPDFLAFLRMAAHSRPYPLATPIWAEIAANDIPAAFQKALLNPAAAEQVFRDLDASLTKKLNDR